MPRKAKPKLSTDAKPAAPAPSGDFSLEAILQGLDTTPAVPPAEVEATVEIAKGPDPELPPDHPQNTQVFRHPVVFVNEPVMDISEIATVDEGAALKDAVAALDVLHEQPVEEDVAASLYKLTEQDREAIVYGVVKMENSPSDVAACYGVTPQVVLLAIKMASLAAEHHAGDVHRS